MATVALVFAVSALQAYAEQSVEGLWLSGDGDGWIQITLSSAGPVGTIAGSPNNPEVPRYDHLNPDEALNGRPLLGLAILDSFTPAGVGKWTDGRIYDPNSGKTYRCNLTLVGGDKLKVRGYVGVSILGRTEVWTRAAN